jgi:hypothetical protein
MAAGNFKIATVNATDLVCIPNARDALFAKTLIGSNWLEARMGVFYTWVPAGNDDAACATEAIVPASYLDWFTFGLKNSDNANCPGLAGARFLGMCWNAEAADQLNLVKNDVASGSFGASNNRRGFASLNGVTVITFTDFATSMIFPVWSAGAIHAFWALKLTVQNYGLANQTVTMSMAHTDTAQADVSSAALRNLIFNNIYSAGKVMNWFSDGAALPLPDAIWIRSPMNLHRLRLSGVDCFKISA